MNQSNAAEKLDLRIIEPPTIEKVERVPRRLPDLPHEDLPNLGKPYSWGDYLAIWAIIWALVGLLNWVFFWSG